MSMRFNRHNVRASVAMASLLRVPHLAEATWIRSLASLAYSLPMVVYRQWAWRETSSTKGDKMTTGLAYLGSRVQLSRSTFTRDREASCGDLSAIGKTIAEAKANLAERIEYALTGSYEPIVIMHGEYVAIAHRTLDGQWVSYIRRGNERQGCTSYGNYRESSENAEDDLRKTFAQYLDGLGIDGGAVIRPWHREDLNSYRAWQAAWRIARMDGAEDPRTFADSHRSPVFIREHLAKTASAPFGPSPYCSCEDTHHPYCPDFVAQLA